MSHGRILSLAAVLIVVAFFCAPSAQADDVAYPNPAPNGYVKITTTLGGGRILSFTDRALADGGHPGGTVFNLYLDERRPGNSDPLTEEDLQLTTPGKSSDAEQTFTFNLNNAQITPPVWVGGAEDAVRSWPYPTHLGSMGNVGPFPIPEAYTGLHRGAEYLWRVDAVGDAEQGTPWRFFTTLADPGPALGTVSQINTEVGLYVRFMWDPLSDERIPVHGVPDAVPPEPTIASFEGPFREELYIIDDDATDPNYIRTWVTYDDDGVSNLYEGHDAKQYNPASDDPRERLREFWVLDAIYPGVFYAGFEGGRLLPDRDYRWRILYRDANGDPMYVDEDMNGAKGAGESFFWADGYDDSYAGWRFHTVQPVHELQNGAVYNTSSTTCESMIIYWQDPHGVATRDPREGHYNFRTEAEAISQVHRLNHSPSIDTAIVGNEELAAGYSGPNQRPFVDEITDFTGWYTMDRTAKTQITPYPFPASDTNYDSSPQDKYAEWISRGIRTYLQDANDTTPGIPSMVYHPNLQYVVLLGDAEHVAPSFYDYDISTGWTPTDFFYRTQGVDAAPSLDPHYQVSRIPAFATRFHTIDQDGLAVTVNQNVNPVVEAEQPFVNKIRDYAILLNSNAKKSDAFQTWFGRAVMANGPTYQDQWYQFFSGYAQHLIGLEVNSGGGIMRDLFSGLLVRRYDLYNNDPDEQLTRDNILRHLSNPADPDDIPGLIFLNLPGTSDRTGMDADITPVDWLLNTDFTELYPFAEQAAGRRPFVLSPTARIAQFDSTIFNDTEMSLAQSAILAEGGPIGFIGFNSGRPTVRQIIHRTWPDGTTYRTRWSGNGVDMPEGYTSVIIDQGTLQFSAATDTAEGDPIPDPTAGKVEIIKYAARAYGLTTQPGMGNLFNRALADYVTAHMDEFVDDGTSTSGQRAISAAFSAQLFGDCALFMPQLQRTASDPVRPALTDTNLRPATNVDGYGEVPQYNSQGMPVNIIPADSMELGTPVNIRIVTDAPVIRVRVMTPFLGNGSYTPGAWFSAAEVPENAVEEYANPTGVVNYVFHAFTPSIYFLVVQAQNPAYTVGIDDPEWRWQQERWFFVQVVNEFVRDPSANILVIDNDQVDKWHLMGQADRHHEIYYVNPWQDGDGYEVGVEDPRDIDEGPALALLNKETGEDMGEASKYRYQYGSTAVYDAAADDADLIRDAGHYYGELTPDIIKSFQDSKGVIVYYDGDHSRLGPEGYLFRDETTDYSIIQWLATYIDNGGRFALFSQDAADEGISTGDSGGGDGFVEHSLPYMRTFLSDHLASIITVQDTDLTNMDGLKAETWSDTVQDVNVAGGDGANNATLTAEVDPNGLEARVAATWDTTAGPPGTTPPISSLGSSIVNRNMLTGGRTAFMVWPFEAIDHVGDLTAGNSGRENVMRQILDYLRAVPKARTPFPANGAVNVLLDVDLSWSRVPEAQYYRVFIGTNLLTLDQGTAYIVGRDDPVLSPPGGLLQNTRYFWRVDTRNVDDFTIGDVWVFNTIAPPPKALTPSPFNGQTQVDVSHMFTWSDSPLVDTWDITFWKNGVQFQQALGLIEPLYTPNPPLDPASNYTWRVDTTNALTTTTGDIWSFSSITPPPAPLNPNPANGANNVLTNQVLRWSETARTYEYHVFVWRTGLDPIPGPNVSAENFNDLSGVSMPNSWSPGELDINTSYSWEVRPWNPAGYQNTVTRWTFNTANFVANPLPPANPNPTDGETGVSINPTLTWQRGGGSVNHDVYFWIGDDEEPDSPTVSNTTATSYSPRNLALGTVGHWRVVARNSLGAVAAGPVWSFTVGAEQVTGYNPADGAIAVDPAVTLDWDSADGAAFYQVYLWTTGNAPRTPTATVVNSEFKPPVNLLDSTQYNWRVDAVSHGGDPTLGLVAGFFTGTTTGMPEQVTGYDPEDGDTNVSIHTALSWEPAGGAGSYRLYLGVDQLPMDPTATLTEVTYQPPAPLELSTTYRWRVDSVAPDGITVVTGDIAVFTTRATDEGVPGDDDDDDDGGGGGGGSCFIATAAYDSILLGMTGITEINCTGVYRLSPERAQKLNDIRAIRDSILMRTDAGRAFSAWYYAVGPYAATAIRDSEPAKAAVRSLLVDPLSNLSRSCREVEK